MLTTYTKLQLFALMAKYDVDVISYSPGNVVVRIGRWRQYQEIFSEILEIVRKEPLIFSVTVFENTISVLYDPVIIEESGKIQELLTLIKKYQL